MQAEQYTIGSICIAKESYQAKEPSELTFEQGDVLTIVEDSKDALSIKMSGPSGNIGLVPIASTLRRLPVSMVPMPWFHGTISRFDAEKLLDRNKDGQFLLRAGQHPQGVYALAVSTRGEVHHYLVAMDFKTRKLTVNGERFFESLPSLVDFYLKNAVDLAHPLKEPLVRKGCLEYCVDTDFLQAKWALNPACVTQSEVIGQGEFGEVYSGVYRGTPVAIKGIHEDKQSTAALASFTREAAIMTKLKHKNLVQLIGLVFSGSTLKSIVMELADKGCLSKYLISRGRRVVLPDELLSIAREVCEGMLFISSQGYVHRDLAARNVLITTNGTVKLSDFGLARKADIFVPHEGGKFPVKWTAPEALKESKFSIKSDVWSFGIVLWELYSYGRSPYPSIMVDDVLEELENGYVMDQPDACPDGVYDLMCKCWEMEPADRPSFQSLQLLLQQSFSHGEKAPVPTPPVKLSIVPQVESIIVSPIATKAYREAPISRKATLHVGTVAVLGPEGSGKTSLAKFFKGEPFMIAEPPSLRIGIEEAYRQLQASSAWLPVEGGLVYEDELVKIVIDDVLKHTRALLNDDGGDGLLPPLPLFPMKRSSSTSGLLRFDATTTTTTAGAPTLHSNGSSSPMHASAVHRLSGSYEVLGSDTPEGHLQRSSLRRSQPVATVLSSPPPDKKLSFIRSLTSKIRSSLRERGEKNHLPPTTLKEEVVAAPPTQQPQRPPPRNVSLPEHLNTSLPERLVEKIKEELVTCVGGTLPTKLYVRLIDVPGSSPFAAVKYLFVPEMCVCILTVDISRPIGKEEQQHSPNPMRRTSSGGRPHLGTATATTRGPYLQQVMSEISHICLHWSQNNVDMSLRGPRIVLVGTHSDAVTALEADRHFEALHEAIGASPYEKFVASQRFVVSASLESSQQSNLQDLRQYIAELVKKTCRQQVPLRWLRCVRRLRGMCQKGVYFTSLLETTKLVSELCDLCQLEEVKDVIQFLHRNQVILHFGMVHQLKDVVITNPFWFATQLSAILSAPLRDQRSIPHHLAADCSVLRKRGHLSMQLLDYLWRDCRAHRDELLSIMHKMDLLYCMGVDSPSLSPSLSSTGLDGEARVGGGGGGGGLGLRRVSKFAVAATVIVVPSLVEEAAPPRVFGTPCYDAEPLCFRFSDHLPTSLFHRLLVRCMGCYQKGFSVYRNAATFEVDPSSLLLLLAEPCSIQVSLHKWGRSSESSFAPTNLDDLINNKAAPNPDTCMAVLMFLQAAVSDLIQQWMPHLDFHLCVSCRCAKSKAGAQHFVRLSEVDNLLQRSSVRCEEGTSTVMQPSITCWFGEMSTHRAKSPVDDNPECITEEDIQLASKDLGASWYELGQILGFNKMELEKLSQSAVSGKVKAATLLLREWKTLHPQNATFFALLRALEIVQRRDVSDNLVTVRMLGGGGVAV